MPHTIDFFPISRTHYEFHLLSWVCLKTLNLKTLKLSYTSKQLDPELLYVYYYQSISLHTRTNHHSPLEKSHIKTIEKRQTPIEHTRRCQTHTLQPNDHFISY